MAVADQRAGLYKVVQTHNESTVTSSLWEKKSTGYTGGQEILIFTEAEYLLIMFTRSRDWTHCCRFIRSSSSHSLFLQYNLKLSSYLCPYFANGLWPCDFVVFPISFLPYSIFTAVRFCWCFLFIAIHISSIAYFIYSLRHGCSSVKFCFVWEFGRFNYVVLGFPVLHSGRQSPNNWLFR